MKKLFLFWLGCILSFSLAAASFQIRSLDIQAELTENATLKVKEIITYDIDEINGILFDLDAKGNEPLSNIEVYATDEQGKFQQIPKENIEIWEEDELYHFKIYARTLNQIRKFAIFYTLNGGAKIYNDVGEINRVFVGKNWQNPIDEVSVKITLPRSVAQDSIKAFGHGPLTGNIELQGHSIQYQLQDYYPGDFVEAHILFETSSFQNVAPNLRIEENVKEKLLEKERKMAEEANAERERYQALQKQGNIFFGFFSLTMISILGIAKFILRRAPKSKEGEIEYLRDLPDDNPPAIIGKLFQRKGYELIFATLMDFVRRKHLILENRGEEQYLTLPVSSPIDDSLQKYEKTLFDIYIHQLGNGKEVNLSSLAKKKLSLSASQRILHWKDSVESLYRTKKFGTTNSVWRFPLAILCIFLIFISCFAIAYFENFLFAVALPILFMIVLPYVLGSTFPNEKTQSTLLKWKAFQRFLSDYSLLEEANITSIHLWEHYFVYALVLGVADKVAKAYEFAVQRGNIIPPPNAFSYAPCLYSYRHNPELAKNIQKNYQRSVSSISRSQRSSTSGSFGGGFSSGSSGGGGSRGGGGAF